MISWPRSSNVPGIIAVPIWSTIRTGTASSVPHRSRTVHQHLVGWVVQELLGVLHQAEAVIERLRILRLAVVKLEKEIEGEVTLIAVVVFRRDQTGKHPVHL